MRTAGFTSARRLTRGFVAAASPGQHAALVQGASRGLGLEFVRQLLEEEAPGGRGGGLVVATCRDPANAEELRVLSAKHPSQLHVLPLDVTQQATIDAAAEYVQTHVGSLNLLLNVTGVLHSPEGLAPERALAKVEAANLLQSYHVNAVGPTMVTRAFAPLLQSTATATHNSPWPVVVANLSARVSSVGDNRLGGWHSYRASKCALNQLTKCVAIEFSRRKHPVTCILLHPGTVNTDLSRPFHGNVPELFTKERAIEQLLGVIAKSTHEDTGSLFAWDGQKIVW